MNNGKIVILSEDTRVRELIERSLDQRNASVATVRSAESLMKSMAENDTMAVAVDLANRAVNGETLWSLAGIAELHRIPLIIVSRQTRLEVMSLARVVGARDVISTAEPRQIIAGRMRFWMSERETPLQASA
jgi:PleD family two-component response regulator